MGCAPQTTQFLPQSFAETPKLGWRAEDNLSDPADYGLATLRLVAEPSIDEETREIAALKFKNHLKSRLVPSAGIPIPDEKGHEELFVSDDILQQIAIPNVMLRDEDEKVFEKDPMEFIRRDMEEGSGTRRRIACELLKGSAGNYKENITAQIRKCLALFDENPKGNWKYKECAIYLFVSLATKEAISTDVESFFISVIVPELQQKDVKNHFPMLKAAALKFFTKFRVLIPKHVALPLLGDVVRFVGSRVKVVHSYAATCIEKLLLVKDNPNGLLQARYTSSDIDPVLYDLLCNLFYALPKPPFSTQHNQYIMRCINRVFHKATDISPGMLSRCIYYLTKALTSVCLDPEKNPLFNHLLFEAVASLARRACGKHLTDFETFILSFVQRMLVPELYPYGFQLLAQLVDLNNVSVPPVYMHVFDDIMVLGPLWETSANVPALVRLVQSLLQQAPNEFLVNSKERLSHVVGKIDKLVSSPTTEEDGFRLLITVIENYGYGDISEYMNYIWAPLLHRLQNSTTPSLVRGVMVFMSLFLVKHGVPTLVDLFEVSFFHDVILGGFWIPNLKTITTNNYTEIKLCAVASTKLLCESASLLDPSAEELWGKLLDATVTLLSLPLPLPLPLPPRVEDEDEDDDDDEPQLTGYPGSKFVRLQSVYHKEELDDPLKEIEDPKQFFVVMTKHLSLPHQAALAKLCNSYNIAIL